MTGKELFEKLSRGDVISLEDILSIKWTPCSGELQGVFPIDKNGNEIKGVIIDESI